jgi:hypothetical protein
VSVGKAYRWEAEVFRRRFGRHDAMVEAFPGYWYWEVGHAGGKKIAGGHKPDEKAAKLACRRFIENLRKATSHPNPEPKEKPG